MKGSRRNHFSKFNAKLALEALRVESTLSALGSRHGVHTTQINSDQGSQFTDDDFTAPLLEKKCTSAWMVSGAGWTMPLSNDFGAA